MFSRERAADDLHELLLAAVLVPQAVRAEQLRLPENFGVQKRGHNDDFDLRLLFLDLCGGSKTILPVFRLHVHED